MREGQKTGSGLRQCIRKINQYYGELLDSGREAEAGRLAHDLFGLNRELLYIFRKEQDYFVRLNWHDEVLFPHQAVQENLRALDRALMCLKEQNVQGALEAVYTIDNNRYAFLFEREVYQYFTEYVLDQPAERLKWGAGRIVHHQNLFDLVWDLKAKGKEGKENTREEQERLERAREEQLACYEDDIRYMLASSRKIRLAAEAARKKVMDFMSL